MFQTPAISPFEWVRNRHFDLNGLTSDDAIRVAVQLLGSAQERRISKPDILALVRAEFQAKSVTTAEEWDDVPKWK